MAILYATGWEAGSLAYYEKSSAGWMIGSTPFMSSAPGDQHRTTSGVGGNYSNIVDDWCYCVANTVDPTQSRWLHFWMLRKNLGGSILNTQFIRGGVLQTQVYFKANGDIELKRFTTVLLTQAAAYDPAVSHWIAIEATCLDSGGVLNVYVDNVLAASFTGDTKYAASDGWDSWGWGDCTYGGGGLSNNYTVVDDVLVTDVTTGKFGEQFMKALTPSSDTPGASLDSSGGPGSEHYANVNAIPLNDTTYNSATTDTQEDRYGFTSVGVPINVRGLAFNARVVRQGDLAFGQITLQSGATVAAGPLKALAASPDYLGIQHFLELDPATGLPWTSAAAANILAGVRFAKTLPVADQIMALLNASGLGKPWALHVASDRDIVHSSGVISVWKDSSGNNRHLNVVSGTAPTYSTFGAVPQPCVLFNGGGIKTTALGSFGDFTVLTIFRDVSTVTSYERLLDHDFANGYWLGRNALTANSWGGGAIVYAAPNGQYTTVTDGVTHLFGMRRFTNVQQLMLNGTLASGMTGSTATTLSQSVGIGNTVTGPNFYSSNSQMAVHIVMARSITDVEHQLLYNLLKPIYNLP